MTAQPLSLKGVDLLAEIERLKRELGLAALRARLFEDFVVAA